MDFDNCDNVGTSYELAHSAEDRCNAVQLDGTDDGTSPACTFTPQACEECDPIEGAATVVCTSAGDSEPASAEDGYFWTEGQPETEYTQGQGDIPATVTACTSIQGATSVACTSADDSVPTSVPDGYYVLQDGDTAPCIDDPLWTVSLNSGENLRCDKIHEHPYDSEGYPEACSSNWNYESDAGRRAIDACLVSCEICEAGGDFTYGGPPAVTACHLEGAAVVTCTDGYDAVPGGAIDGYFFTAEHTDAATGICISTAAGDGPGDPDFDTCAAVAAMDDDVACMAVETAADDDGDARACEHYTPGEAIPCQPGGPCQPATVTECTPIDGAASVICTDDTDSEATRAAEGYFFTAAGSAAPPCADDPDFAIDNDGTTTYCTGIYIETTCENLDFSHGLDGRHIREACPLLCGMCEAGERFVDGQWLLVPGTVTECAPIENALTVSCTDESDSVPSSATEGYYLYAECTDDPDWEYVGYYCTYYASNRHRCDTDGGSGYGGTGSEACPVACGTCGELSAEVIALACTPIEGATTVICTDESDSVPTSAAAGYFIGDGSCADDPDWTYMGSFCEDMVHHEDMVYLCSAAAGYYSAGDEHDERTMREACPVMCGACDDVVIPDVAIACTPIDGADAVLCTNADDSRVPCEPGDFYSRSSLACEECIPVEGAASVLCTTDSDSVPTSAAEGWYFTPDGGFAGTVTRCTPIEGASSVSCSHLVAITNSVVVSCDNDLELIDGTCVDNRSTTIDCDAVDVSLPCNVMALVAQLREAAAHDVLLIEVIDPVTFCPCKAVLDASPDWTPNVVQSCDGGN